MKYAQIVAGRVHGVFEYKSLPEFAPNIVMIELPEGSPVAAGWRYDGAVFSEPEPMVADWPAAIAARRYDAEVGGISVNGMTIDTGRDSQALITGATVAAMRDPAYICRWKTAAGFVELGAEQLIGVADSVRAHVQACFDREADLLEALKAGTLTPEMLEEGWPNEPLPESAPS